MINVSIIGATGYVGLELTRILVNHPEVTLKHLVSQSFVGQDMANIYRSLKNVLCHQLEGLDIDTITADSDVIFTSLPHGTSDVVIPQLVESGVKVIDMSGDFRYKDVNVYNTWYKTTHSRPDILAQSVYGLPELHKAEITKSKLVGNPGCYTTCSILALAPLVKAGLLDTDSIVIDAKSGATGAGRNPSQDLHFCEIGQSMKAYNVTTHRHTSEIEQELSLVASSNVMVSFTPHLLPINRGILATSVAKLTKKVTHDEVLTIFKECYANEPFVFINESGKLPELKHVVGSNFCHIGFVIDERLGRIVIVSVIDNLIKGAAGQAIQNMNLVFGLDETMGLNTPAWYL